VPACATLFWETVALLVLDLSADGMSASAGRRRRPTGIWVSAARPPAGRPTEEVRPLDDGLVFDALGDVMLAARERDGSLCSAASGTGRLSSPGAASCAPSASTQICLRGGDRMAAGASRDRAALFEGERERCSMRTLVHFARSPTERKREKL
jgi:hypothetical protein